MSAEPVPSMPRSTETSVRPSCAKRSRRAWGIVRPQQPPSGLRGAFSANSRARTRPPPPKHRAERQGGGSGAAFHRVWNRKRRDRADPALPACFTESGGRQRGGWHPREPMEVVMRETLTTMQGGWWRRQRPNEGCKRGVRLLSRRRGQRAGGCDRRRRQVSLGQTTTNLMPARWVRRLGKGEVIIGSARDGGTAPPRSSRKLSLSNIRQADARLRRAGEGLAHRPLPPRLEAMMLSLEKNIGRILSGTATCRSRRKRTDAIGSGWYLRLVLPRACSRKIESDGCRDDRREGSAIAAGYLCLHQSNSPSDPGDGVILGEMTRSWC